MVLIMAVCIILHSETLTHGVKYVPGRVKPHEELVARAYDMGIIGRYGPCRNTIKTYPGLLKLTHTYEIDFNSHLYGTLASGRRID